MAASWVTLYVVRHADAGDRTTWTARDDRRPLSPKGWRQADGLVGLLEPYPVERVASSPYLRCRQTVEPLARVRRLPIAGAKALAEGGSAEGLLELGEELGGDVVLCSHGDVIQDLVEVLGERGLIEGQGRLQKGSTWIVELVDGSPVGARYLPPPPT